ncbi:hypothetical protein A8W25_09075 [Streptomyces sp. ERV7]|uniref:hypothetical protein n=1 Tax=Streptomyces sp. ERV7 TaxID=1322334 RepID=UPI0007F3FA1A|nr:hypothetical protein [Streptomyces sp. ERV7]OAR25696.1 hypothetical protein A8W25_09075 [Streptomyces sp. ERV7]
MTLVAPQIRIRRPRLATLLTGAGIALVPWMAVLAKTLPQTVEVSNWPLAWIGLDAGLAVGLAGTGVLLRRGDPRVSPVAAATGALLLMDAWFDVTTSAGPERVMAVALAVCAEVPLAVACGVVAGRRA